ncbi:MAG: hypothetical protein H7A25_03155 [Leptospiraceae bacterium]|nr:hypothetical protein [Leptospiraceae bacterium]MCP5498875.1 hypothetical protein [Leptospiraceae bacterium]
MKAFTKFIIFLLLILFTYQHYADSSIFCGEVGDVEDHCAFSIHNLLPDSEHDRDSEECEHICINCPCNFIYFSNVSLYLNKIYTRELLSYRIYDLKDTYFFLYKEKLIRPPRQDIS